MKKTKGHTMLKLYIATIIGIWLVATWFMGCFWLLTDLNWNWKVYLGILGFLEGLGLLAGFMGEHWDDIKL